MRVLILGSGAGGGVPQWNCRCRVCTLAWDRPDKVCRRSETSIAVTADDREWVVFDAPPGLRERIIETRALWPRTSGRTSPIAAVVLTSGDIDHVAGLLSLRESQPLSLFAAKPVLDILAATPLFDALGAKTVRRSALHPDAPVVIAGLAVTPFIVPGKVPLYRESGSVAVGEATEDVIGLEISDGHCRLAYVPGIAWLPKALVERLGAADLLLLDGTTFTDDELLTAGVGTKTARRMGHLPISGDGGSLHAFPVGRPALRTYIHLNNTNPVLIEDSPERAQVLDAGWTVAHDGLEIVL